MLLENWLFYLLYFLILFSSLMVILSENAVYSVLFLILTFCNTVLLLLLMGIEFFAFLLLIVYVGAIAVLFLFVVMMLNVKKTTLFGLGNLIYFVPLIFVSLIFILDFFYSLNLSFDVLKNLNYDIILINWIDQLTYKTNIETIGYVLYTNYSFLFITSSFILLISMIGVIVLTIHQKTNYILKRQNINNQLIRDSKMIIKFVNLRK
uniref:NADH-ubiquinone oxidoreductase chain 6 n=1 Tax=Osmundea sinicola TaxID=290685 RepID=A0A7L4WPD8_9FLOR|nr:NADH dehydrogenase subunit 6 [Osmundea sinicola]QFR99778.1 NADH dehydrogenase subunit 6 [Osmundea sinicola]